MKILIALLTLGFAVQVFAEGSLGIDVTLSPAGSFTAKSTAVSGFAYKSGDQVIAEEVTIDLRNLSTGISLRDKHTKERLMVEKFPQAKLVKAVGKGGAGKAIIMVKGKQQQVSGSYKVEGQMLKAEFPMKMSDLGINDVRYMGVGANDQVTVRVEVPLKDAPPAGRATASSVKAKGKGK